MQRVSKVAVYDIDGKLLVGKRSIDGRWDLPGGFVEPGETPNAAAIREVNEESGIQIQPDHMFPLGNDLVDCPHLGHPLHIFSFVVHGCDQQVSVHMTEDDEEGHAWSWINVDNGLPQDILQQWNHLNSPILHRLGYVSDETLLTPAKDGKSDIQESTEKSETFDKAFPKEYNRVVGQDKGKGVASKKQYGFMQAMAAGNIAGKDSGVGKDYIKNSPSKDSLPDSGSGGKRGERNKHKKKLKKALELIDSGLENTGWTLATGLADELEKDNKQLINEHKKLIQVLRSGDKKRLAEEAEEQNKELDDYIENKPADSPLVVEHKRLVNHLQTADTKSIQDEITRQSGELKELQDGKPYKPHNGNIETYKKGDSVPVDEPLMKPRGPGARSRIFGARSRLAHYDQDKKQETTLKVLGMQKTAVPMREWLLDAIDESKVSLQDAVDFADVFSEMALSKSDDEADAMYDIVDIVINQVMNPIQQTAYEVLGELAEGMEKSDSPLMSLVDANHHVPYLGGCSVDGNTVYIDQRFPEWIPPTDEGEQPINTHSYLAIHEIVERNLMMHGFHYNVAHNIASAAEEAALLLDGHDPTIYYGITSVTYNKTLREFDPLMVPLDLDMTPYKEDELDSIYRRIECARDSIKRSVHKAMGCGEMDKSNYGPKGAGLYDTKDNVKRKSRNVGEAVPDAGKIVNAKEFTPSTQGTFAEQNKRQEKEEKKKNKKQPVKVGTPEEIAALNAQYANKSDDEEDDIEKSKDNVGHVVGKINGESYRIVHGYKQFCSGPRRGEYVARVKAEKRVGRKLRTDEHVHHTTHNRQSDKTEILSASKHSAETNKARANSKGCGGKRKYEHTGGH